MAWDDIRSGLQAAVEDEKPHESKGSIIGSMGALSAFGGLLMAALLIPATAFAAYTSNDVTEKVMELPLVLKQDPTPQTTRVLAADGSLLAYFYSENREDVPLDKISPNMRNALLSIEDNRFYEHGALDTKGTFRALVNNASDGSTQGGSTITQQLVKLILVQQATTKEEYLAATKKSAARKARELKYAIAYEKEHSKDEILETYLNIAYYGSSAYGIKSAAKRFFSTDPSKLTVSQAATIAGLVKNPVEFDPIVYPERALQRRNTVLAVMAGLGKITQAKAQDLQAQPLGLKVTDFPNGCVSSIAAFSCDYVRQFLLQDKSLGSTYADRKARLNTGGLTIRSTIDVDMQEALNKSAKDHVDARNNAIGGLASIEPGTGRVRALAQSRPMGRDKSKGQTFINFTVPKKYGYSNGFQAGSTFKMFTVAAALKKGMSVGTTYNSPPSLTMPSGTYFTCTGDGTGQWKVKNSTANGSMNMYTGTRLSVNTYFAQLEKSAGLCNTYSVAQRMGIQVPDTDKVPSFTLGVVDVSPLDMAAAYATAASGGEYCKPLPVADIRDATGKVIKKYEPDCDKVLTKDQAAQINDILAGLQKPGGFGYNNGTGLNIASAAKTGTTNDNKAVWYVGYTPRIATAAMIAGANQKGQPRSLNGTKVKGRIVSFNEAGGSTLAGPMWADAMKKIQYMIAPKSFDSPPQGQPANRPANDGGGDRGGNRGGDNRGGGGNGGGRGRG